MNTLQTYSFHDRPVRVAGTPEDPLFCAADVCQVLGLGNPSMATAKLDDDEKGISSIDTLGGEQQVLVLTEAGLYTLILRCRDAVTPGTAAHGFRKWVTGEVLPSIRKTGTYSAAGLSALDQLELMLKAAREQERQLAEVRALAIQANSYNSANTGFYTVRAYANVHGIRLSLSEAKEIGQRASRLCRAHGVQMGQAKDELFGQVNSYPVEVLDEVFGVHNLQGGAKALGAGANS